MTIEEIASKSYKNCHAIGVDSLLLVDEPGFKVRMFFAHTHHELFKNDCDQLFSVGLHQHHCDITLIPAMGEFYNVSILPEESNFVMKMSSYTYLSPILSKNRPPKFQLSGEEKDINLDWNKVDRPLFLPAQSHHTVYVPFESEAAWYVIEGKEDPTYKSITLSNTDLEKFEFDKFYLPMSVADVKYIFKTLNMYRRRNSRSF